MKGRVKHPDTQRMVNRGTEVYLEPDRYPKHMALVQKFERVPGWKRIVDPEPPKREIELEDETESDDGLLPHQLAAVERIRQLQSNS